VERKKRVLVVDDESAILNFVRIKLRLAGYEVITTTSGEEALELAEKEKPDIMLVDVLMQPLTGLDVLTRLRTFSQLPVIIFSANDRVVSMARQEGANDYIAKPFNPDQLIGKIESVLNSSQMAKGQS
jgi:two-component system, OmpR family, KDP operon response regulator KdpE